MAADTLPVGGGLVRVSGGGAAFTVSANGNNVVIPTGNNTKLAGFNEYVLDPARPGMGGSKTLIDNCDATTGWSFFTGTGTLSVENGRLKVVGTADGSGLIIIEKVFTGNKLSDYDFVTFYIQPSSPAPCMANVIDETWKSNLYNHASTSVPVTNTKITLDLNAAVGTDYTAPTWKDADWGTGNLKAFRVGITDLAAGGSITFYVDDINFESGSGATTYEFDNSDNADTGLLNMVYPWFALMDSGGRVEYYIFTDRPAALTVNCDDSGALTEITVDPGNSQVFRGETWLTDQTTDSNADLIPDCIKNVLMPALSGWAWNDWGEIIITTTGQTFAPILTVGAGGAVAWRFSNGATSTSATPSIDFGTAATRKHYLKVTPWTALQKINFGYTGDDEGVTPGPTTLAELAQQNVISITGLQNATDLEMFAASYNPITALDVSGLQKLTTIECYEASLQSIILNDLPALTRLCIEANALHSVDVSGALALEDLRCAQNANPMDVIFGDCGDHIWHLCIRSNTFVSSWTLPDLDKFPLLRQLYFWTVNQSGKVLDVKGLALQQVDAGYVAWADVIIEDSCTSLVYVILNSCSLSQALVDYILTRLDTLGVTWGTLRLDGDNAAPSAAGLVHKTSLEGKSWTVTVTE